MVVSRVVVTLERCHSFVAVTKREVGACWGCDLCNPSNIWGSGGDGNFKDCGVSFFFFFFNDRQMLKEEYDSQPSAQSVCP